MRALAHTPSTSYLKTAGVFTVCASMLLLLFIIIIPQPGKAQTGAENLVSLSSEPRVPSPESITTFTANYYQSDISQARFQWYKNGTLIEDGVGIRRITTRVGGEGERTTVRVVITTEEGEVLSKSIVVRPVDYTLIWEADSSTPPFYEGKALAAPRGAVRVAAVPKSFSPLDETIGARGLVYEWRLDGKLLAAGSGAGKSVIEFPAKPLGGKTAVTVTISNNAGDVIAQKTQGVRSANPEILFYEERPLEGPQFASTLTNLRLSADDERVLRGEPFYFSREGGTIFRWSLNNTPVSPRSTNRKLVGLALPPELQDGAGQSVLELSVESAATQFQRARGSLLINF